jgi:DEAD/DEAH box helicase domain-containing protein
MKSTKSSVRIKLSSSFWNHRFCIPFSEDVVPSSLFLKHRNFLIVDVETQHLAQEVGGWDHLDQLRVSIACAYDSKTDQFLTFREHELKSLIELCKERLVVGFNIRGFDLPVMSPYGLDPKELDIFDLMLDLETRTRQRYLKLEAVAQGTLGVGKLADGLKAVEWWKAGEIEKIIEYCLLDVKITRDIFLFGRERGFVKVMRASQPTPIALEIPVQWN